MLHRAKGSAAVIKVKDLEMGGGGDFSEFSRLAQTIHESFKAYNLLQLQRVREMTA